MRAAVPLSPAEARLRELGRAEVDLLLVMVGAAVLAYSGNRLVDFAAALAEKVRLSPAVIGLTSWPRAPPLLVDERLVTVDLWVMMAFTVVLLPLVFRKSLLTRGAGAGLLAAYAAYVAWLALNPR